jgi:hypothetical protein
VLPAQEQSLDILRHRLSEKENGWRAEALPVKGKKEAPPRATQEQDYHRQEEGHVR